ncbi:D-methionine transport system substrate-binding protein [Bacillus fengqiuensis]|nr:D-methionine transport system substrate-binding protein [Bacillus fengqiuensis]
MKKKILGIFLIGTILTSLAGCTGNKEATQGKSSEITIKVGVTAGPFEEITNKVKEVAKEEGIDVKVVPFNDYIMPNRALVKGDVDVNTYQNIPFLETYNKDHKTNIVPVGKTVAMLMGIYSKKYKSIEDLPDGAILGLQNDPVNRSRALHVYQQAGLIKLKPNTDEDKAIVQDIAENPKNFTFKELEAGLLARTLTSLDASTINGNYALQEGYEPKKDAIFLNNEDKYVNVVATNEKNKDNPNYKKLVELYNSDEVKQFIREKYKGVVITTEDPFKLK